MKIGFFATALFISTTLYAQFPIANITQFSGNYLEPSGKATATNFKWEEYDFGANPNISFERQGSAIFIEANNERFELSNLPDFINNVESLTWQSIDFTSNVNYFSLNIPKFKSVTKDSSVAVSNLNLKCEYSGTSFEDVKKSILDSCLNHRSSFKSTSLGMGASSGNSINNLNFEVTKKSLTFSLKSGVNVNGTGEIDYDSKNDFIKIKINTAKTGGINIRSKFFKELKALESENIKVQEPYIEIKL